jgi:hypothetical protein
MRNVYIKYRDSIKTAKYAETRYAPPLLRKVSPKQKQGTRYIHKDVVTGYETSVMW